MIIDDDGVGERCWAYSEENIAGSILNQLGIDRELNGQSAWRT